MKIKPIVVIALLFLLGLLIVAEFNYRAHSQTINEFRAGETDDSLFVVLHICGRSDKSDGRYVDQPAFVLKKTIVAVGKHREGRDDCVTVQFQNGSKIFVYGTLMQIMNRVDPGNQAFGHKAE